MRGSFVTDALQRIANLCQSGVGQKNNLRFIPLHHHFVVDPLRAMRLHGNTRVFPINARLSWRSHPLNGSPQSLCSV